MKFARDRKLVERILAGDREEAERLVTEAYPRVYRFLRFLARDPVLAQDLTQQTFVRAWQALPGYQARATLVTWLQHIAYREWVGWLRSRRAHVSLQDAGELADGRSDRELDGLAIRQLLEGLSEEQREACLLYYLEGFTVVEIAAVLALPPGTVKSRLLAARRKLRSMLEERSEVRYEELPARRPGCQHL